MQKRENPILSLVANVVIPTLILTHFSGESALGPVMGLLAALAIPLAYGLFDYWKQGKVNFFSALGLVSVLLTGGIGLLKLDPKYIALKEAAIPFFVAILVFASVKTKFPLIKTFLVKLTDFEKILAALAARNSLQAFEKSLARANHAFAGSFLLSAALNFALAKWIVVSAPGTEAFNAELGKMTAMSFPVIALPMTLIMAFVLYGTITKIENLTDMRMEEFFVGHRREEERTQT